jgi:chemotaxis protein MotB
MAKKKRESIGGGIGEWVLTYGDMVTLVLCFFVALFNVEDESAVAQVQLVSSLNNVGLGGSVGGSTLTTGRLAELGNTINTLPSMDKGKYLGSAWKKAVALFQPESKSDKVRVTIDERGLVITLASDAFFEAASAEIDIEDTRSMLVQLAEFLKSESVAGRRFRIEGHTDSSPVDPRGEWPSNWELSAARAINTLHYLVDFGADERRFQATGFADTQPLAGNDTEEGKAYNRRVDIIVLDEGHL